MMVMMESKAQNCEGHNVAETVPSTNGKSTITLIKMKYPKVKNVSTSTLYDWMENGIRNDEVNGEGSNEGERQSGKLVIFDVRPTEEYTVSHLSSALRLDPDSHDMERVKHLVQQSENEEEEDGGKEEEQVKPSQTCVTVVMYCSIGYRSSAMADRLQRHLADCSDNSSQELKVYNLQGSIFRWADEHRPLVDCNDQPSEFVHPYSRIWGLLIDRKRWKWSVDSK